MVVSQICILRQFNKTSKGISCGTSSSLVLPPGGTQWRGIFPIGSLLCTCMFLFSMGERSLSVITSAILFRVPSGKMDYS